MKSPVGLVNPVDVLARIEPDIRDHARQQQVPAGAKLLGMPTRLALQVADGPDGLVREQLVASGMHTSERRDRLTGIHVGDDPTGGLEVKVEFAAPDCSLGGASDISDIA